jgi:hypothetical protein
MQDSSSVLFHIPMLPRATASPSEMIRQQTFNELSASAKEECQQDHPGRAQALTCGRGAPPWRLGSCCPASVGLRRKQSAVPRLALTGQARRGQELEAHRMQLPSGVLCSECPAAQPCVQL